MVALVVAGLLAALTAPIGVPVVVAVAVVLAARSARRRGRGLLPTGLVLVAGAPVGLVLWQALQITGGAGPAHLLHALAVTAYATGTTSLLAGIVVLALAWARAGGQRTGPAVAAVAAVGAVGGWNAYWWAWGRAFDLADAGRSTTAYDPVLHVAGWVTVACAGVAGLAAAVTLVRGRHQRRLRPPGPAA